MQTGNTGGQGSGTEKSDMEGHDGDGDAKNSNNFGNSKQSRLGLEKAKNVAQNARFQMYMAFLNFNCIECFETLLFLGYCSSVGSCWLCGWIDRLG